MTLLSSDDVISALKKAEKGSKLAQVLEKSRVLSVPNVNFKNSGSLRTPCIYFIKETRGVPCFRREYSALECSVQLVDSLEAAVDHIHRYGSGHTECIVTEDKTSADLFLKKV